MQNRFEKFARIFSRRHKQTTFSDAGFLGVLRVKRPNQLMEVFVNVKHHHLESVSLYTSFTAEVKKIVTGQDMASIWKTVTVI